MLSRALDAELCRSGGAVQVVGVERGERGERRGDGLGLGLGAKGQGEVRVRFRVRVMVRG